MYIDPNSGGMLFQALLVVFGILSGTVLIFSSKIKMVFARMMRTFRERSSDDETSENVTESNYNNAE